eukprot:snap_masked-scaffold_21-processed-gene-5.40-mRNA-1 protein AED:1.00 eAED:1.00 QI:0/-1/0/0/-1/1/1/0/292
MKIGLVSSLSTFLFFAKAKSLLSHEETARNLQLAFSEVTSAFDGRCLSIGRRVPAAGSPIVAINCDFGMDQLWGYDELTGMIKSGADPNLCVTLTLGAAEITIETCISGYSNQIFKKESEVLSQIFSADGRALEHKMAVDDDPIRASIPDETFYQKWIWQPTKPEPFEFLPLQNTVRRECLFIEPGVDFNNLAGGDCVEIEDKWYFDEVTLTIRHHLDYQKCVTIDTFDELANAFIEDCDGRFEQLWIRDGDLFRLGAVPDRRLAMSFPAVNNNVFLAEETGVIAVGWLFLE